MTIFDGVFFNRDSVSYILANPIEKPKGLEIPDEDELETWDGKGKLIASFDEDDSRYVIVHYNRGAPSDDIGYVYLYDGDEDATV